METKPGYKTSEFWLTLLGTVVGLAGQIQGAIPAPWGLVASTALTAIYTITRAVLKKPQDNP